MGALRVVRKLLLILGLTTTLLALLVLAGALASVVFGMSGDRAGWAKLACMGFLAVGLPLLGTGAALLAAALILHLVMRRWLRGRPGHAFAVICNAASPAITAPPSSPASPSPHR